MSTRGSAAGFHAFQESLSALLKAIYWTKIPVCIHEYEIMRSVRRGLKRFGIDPDILHVYSLIRIFEESRSG